MIPKQLFIALIGSIQVAMSAPALGQCEYDVELIESHQCSGGGFPFTASFNPKAMNDLGWVVGPSTNCDETLFDVPAIWKPGWAESQVLPTPSWHLHGSVYDITNNGDVLCSGEGKPGEGRLPFIVHADGSITELGNLQTGEHAEGLSMNDAGVVCGYAQRDGKYCKAVAWIDGKIVELETPEGRNSCARFVTESGVIVGHYGSSWSDGREPVVWIDGKAHILPVPDGMKDGHLLSATDSGLIVGVAHIPDGSFGEPRPVIWRNGIPQELPMPEPYVVGAALKTNVYEQVFGDLDSKDGPRGNVIWNSGEVHEIYELPAGEEFDEDGRVDDSNAAGQIIATLERVSGGRDHYLITPRARSAADLDLDCDVDVYDLSRLLNDWNTSGTHVDIDQSGVVDVLDLLILLKSWTG